MAHGPSRKIAAALVMAFSALWWCAPGAMAGDSVVDAGKLRADVQQDPWSLTFTDKRGRSVLAEARGTGTGEIGTLGFRTDAGWFAPHESAMRPRRASRSRPCWIRPTLRGAGSRSACRRTGAAPSRSTRPWPEAGSAT